MLAYFQKSPPPGHTKEVAIANSPLSSNVKDYLDNMALPNGIRNQINASQNGISLRSQKERDLLALQTDYQIAVDAVVREYLDTNWVDSAVIYLKEQGSLNAVCALIPLQLTRDSTDAKTHISLVRQAASDLETVKPDDKDINEMRTFCDFHEALLKIKSRPGGYFNLSRQELILLNQIAESNTQMAIHAQGILNFVKGYYSQPIGYDVYFPKRLTQEDVETLFDLDNINTTLSPNPSSGWITLEIDPAITLTPDAEIWITAIDGKLVSTIAVYDHNQSYDLSNLPKGIYLVNFVQHQNRISTHKVVLE